MNAATLSIFIWGIYVMLMGLLLVFIPGKTLILCGQENPKDHRPRIAGIVINFSWILLFELCSK